MGFCRGFCRVLLLIIVIVVVTVCYLFVPGAERKYISVTNKYLGSFAVTRALVYFPVAFRHAWDYGVPMFMAPWWNPVLISAIDGHKGDGIFQAPLFNMNARVSHSSVKAIHYDPKLQRKRDVFVEMNTTKTPAGYFGPGVIPTFLQLNTDDPVRVQRRDLIVATMPSLAEAPSSITSFKPPPDASVEELISAVKAYIRFPVGTPVPVKIQDVYAFNFFRHAFEVELSRAQLELLKEWTTVNFLPLLGLGSASGAARSTEIREDLLSFVAEGTFGKRFLEEAARRGMNGKDNLRQLLWQFVFAGFGGNGPGGALATRFVLAKIQSSPEKYVPMFKHDPNAFVAESVRLYGGGGIGVTSIAAPETKKLTLGDGRVIMEQKGDPIVTCTPHANNDPRVFGGPEQDSDFAAAFVPGRENADRMLNFVSEIRDIRKCPNMTGCSEAPRFCMGTFLVQRLAKQIAEYYVDGLTKNSAAKIGREEM